MSRNSVERWLARPYARAVEFVPDEEGGTYRAFVPQFGRSVNGDGATWREAMDALDQALMATFEVLAEQGDEPSEPVVAAELPSGKLNLRLPAQLHAELQAGAAADHVSLNQYIVTCLAQRHTEHQMRRLIREELAELQQREAAPASLAAWQVVPSKPEPVRLRLAS